MFLSSIRSRISHWSNYGLRLKLHDYPPLMTHGLAVLAGTLLVHGQSVEPSPLPKHLLYPFDKLPPFQEEGWERGPISLMLTKRQGESRCRWSMGPMRMWTVPGGKKQRFLQLELTPGNLKFLESLSKERDLELRRFQDQLKPCLKLDEANFYGP